MPACPDMSVLTHREFNLSSLIQHKHTVMKMLQVFYIDDPCLLHGLLTGGYKLFCLGHTALVSAFWHEAMYSRYSGLLSF